MLSECQFMGNHRTGLQRVAEEVTKELVKMSDMEFYFANTIYFKNFHQALLAYIKSNFPEFERNIITKEPSFLLEFLKFKAAWVKYPRLLFIQPSLKYQPKDSIFHSFYYPFATGKTYKNLKRSITFYDLIPIKYEKSLWYIRERTKKIVKSAETALTISISEFSRNELL
ncbi:MAG TPA: hypothetical protein VHM20_08695, partial [Gammaproteobacteria bacterium]|nr:hypothetical protein [Gammaproteobacteria bacterium]